MIRFRIPPGSGRADLPSLPAATGFDDDYAILSTERPTAALAALTQWAMNRGTELEELTVNPPSLEDAYLRLIDEDGGGTDAG